MDVVFAVAVTIQGEAGVTGFAAMAECAGSIVTRIERAGACPNILYLLEAYSAYKAHVAGTHPITPSDDAIALAKLVVGGSFPSNGRPFFMGQIDVDSQGWVDGDVVIISTQPINGVYFANHSYAKWPIPKRAAGQKCIMDFLRGTL